MAARISDDIRAAIIKDIRAGTLSCRAIATRHGVSPDTVRRVAAIAKVDEPFSRARTKSATAARVADMAAGRAELAADLLRDAQRLRERAWSPHAVVANTPDGPEIVTLPLPPLRDVQAAYTSLGISVDKHIGLVKHDADPGLGTVVSLLEQLGQGLRAKYGNGDDEHSIVDE